MVNHVDLALDDAVSDCLKLEEEVVDAVIEGLTYRDLLRCALQMLHDQTERASALEQRLRQVSGREAWHREEQAEE